MGNMLLAYPNRINAATLSGGSWGSTLDNLKSRDRSLVAESTDALTTSTKFIIDMGASYTIRLLALVGHNGSQAGTFLVKFGTSSGGSEQGSSGSQSLWPMSFDGVMRNFPGQYDSIVGYPYWSPYVHSADVSCRYVTVEISDTGNALGKFRLARVIVGAGLVPQYNADIGSSIHWRDPTKMSRSTGGSLFGQPLRKYRVAKMPLSHFDATERGKLFAAQAGAGVYDELGFVPDVSDMANAQEFGFPAHFSDLGEMPWSLPLAWSTTLDLEELL